MQRRFIKIWTEWLEPDNRIWANPDLLKLWLWCLKKANFTNKRWVSIKSGKGLIDVEVKKGQFVYGRHSAPEDLGAKAETIRSRLNILKNLGFITIQSTSQYSIVTICNYEYFQGQNNALSPAVSPAKPYTEYQPNPTPNTTTVEVKEVEKLKNVKKETKEIFDFWNSQKIIEHREINNFIPEINARLKDYSPEEIKEAIKNYAEILNSDDYIWSYRWSLKDFLGRKKDNIARFLNTSKPFESCPKKIKEPDPFDRSDLEED